MYQALPLLKQVSYHGGVVTTVTADHILTLAIYKAEILPRLSDRYGPGEKSTVPRSRVHRRVGLGELPKKDLIFPVENGVQVFQPLF
jgi:hypothetical protein